MARYRKLENTVVVDTTGPMDARNAIEYCVESASARIVEALEELEEAIDSILHEEYSESLREDLNDDDLV
jgi:hypothetical protein